MHFPQLNKDLKFNLESEWAKKARCYSEDVLSPVAPELDRRAAFPKTQLEELAAMGFFSLRLPKTSGGQGLSSTEYADTMRELSVGCASTAVAVGVSNMVAVMLDSSATADLAEELRPRFHNKDNFLLSFAITEPGSGSDASSIQTSYIETDKGYTITGHKCFISSGAHAHGFVTTARSKTDPKKISSFFVPGDSTGLRIGKAESKMGLLASNTVQLFYEDVEVPKHYLLGDEGSGLKMSLDALNGGRIGIACQALGIAQAAILVTKDWLESKQATQGNRWRLANMATSLEAGMMLIYHAARLADHGRRYQEAASRAKLFCSEQANNIVDQSVSIMGYDGYRLGSEVERHFRDCRVTTLYEGTSEIQRLVIARGLLKQGLEATL